jgi:UDP-GlcNAc3NAcA epimerase
VKILSVVGARPQFIKAAVMSRAFAARTQIHEVLIHTGQHYDDAMSDIFFRDLEIPAPAHHLGIHGGNHGEMTGRMLAALEAVAIAEKPDCVVVYGDTNSTLAAALAAAKLGIPVAHIEAGLRSFDKSMPEEINRVLADHVSRWLFCPTRAAVANLVQEGIRSGVHQVGDVMYDAALLAGEIARQRSTILDRLALAPRGYAVATIHRAGNTDDPSRLRAILDYLRDRVLDQPVVLPLHPRTQFAVQRFALVLEPLLVCPPLGYLDMQQLVQDAAVIFTDSGGLQKEAYFHRVPCVTLRDETEWVETIECGWNRLWRGPDFRPRRDIADYGDGHAGERIAAVLLSDCA